MYSGFATGGADGRFNAGVGICVGEVVGKAVGSAEGSVVGSADGSGDGTATLVTAKSVKVRIIGRTNENISNDESGQTGTYHFFHW